MQAPILTYIFASEIIAGRWSIDNLPGLLRDDIIQLVEELTGKSVAEEESSTPQPEEPSSSDF